LIGTGPIAGIEIKEGRGAIIIFELTLRGLLPWGAGHNNLEGLKLDDHHGGGCDYHAVYQLRISKIFYFERHPNGVFQPAMCMHLFASSNGTHL
jgi:hypothetical protein